jgi:enediyne biosynthesis protein E4
MEPGIPCVGIRLLPRFLPASKSAVPFRLLPLFAILAFAGCSDNATPIQPASGAPASAGSRNAVHQRPRSPGLAEGLPASVRPPDDSVRPPESRPSAVPAGLKFRDVHEDLGLEFVFDNGTSPAKLMVESTSGGAGWLDYDGDGWWDLFLPQGGNPFAEGQARRTSNDQLFRNLQGQAFVRVTSQAGLVDEEFGHGTAVGDFDNDGFDDIYVTNVGPDILYQNQGDGTFLNVTAEAGIDNPLWAASAAWADLDLDGDLDLYVCNYVNYDPRNPAPCLSDDGKPGICHPDALDPVENKCYFNHGDGTFQNEAEERGFNAAKGKSLGVVVADFNRDGLPDVFVANDTMANHLFTNAGDAHFRESAVALGCAMSGLGEHQANMGVGFGDYDGNGFPDLYVTVFTKDSNTLFANFGSSGFQDVTRKSGLHQPTLPYLAFGTVMSDFDANGRQELFVANGHIDDWRERTGDLWYMPPQLFTFDGVKWHECGQAAGPYFEHVWLGRAVATADYDNDGDLDVAVVHQNDPLALLRNDSDAGHRLKLRFIGQQSNRRGIGVQVTVTHQGQDFYQELAGGTSYCTTHQPVMVFGLGADPAGCEVAVRWPSGKRQTLSPVAVDQELVLREADAED